MSEQSYEGLVRPFQLNETAQGQIYAQQQTSRSPISIIAGKTVAAKGLRMFSFSYKAVYTFYMDMSVVEQTTADDSNQILENG